MVRVSVQGGGVKESTEANTDPCDQFSKLNLFSLMFLLNLKVQIKL